jgi:hypothetical protein
MGVNSVFYHAHSGYKIIGKRGYLYFDFHISYRPYLCPDQGTDTLIE